jgi:3,4-dihydroxy 2-butanone 4-phosphate synthase/GTP cyclohydrolase II
VVVDDEDRENEGDLIIAGSKATPDALAFMVRYSSGIVCAAMKGEDLDRLRLPLMVEDKANEEALRTAFTLSVVRICDVLQMLLQFRGEHPFVGSVSSNKAVL